MFESFLDNFMRFGIAGLFRFQELTIAIDGCEVKVRLLD